MNQDNAAPPTHQDDSQQQLSIQKGEDKDEKDPKLTPHTLRLLRIITSSSNNESNHARESTGRAIYLLSKIASQSPPILLWDIIARLYSSLTSPDQSDAVGGGVVKRNNVSLALEHVARYIPVSDQRSFLMGDFDIVEKNDERGVGKEGLVLQRKDVQRHWLCLEDFYIHDDKEKDETVDDRGVIMTSLLDQILENGRLLLSCNEARYCKQEEDVSDYDHETNMLAKLDKSVSGNGEMGRMVCMEDFTRERVALQRNILARRLGLGGILSCSVVDQSVNHIVGASIGVGVVDEDDLLGIVPEKKSSIDNEDITLVDSVEEYHGMSARERNMVRLRKRRRVESQKSGSGKRQGAGCSHDSSGIIDKDDDDDDPSPLRKLLLMSWKQNPRDRQQSQHYSYSSKQLLQSHKTPQILLTSDLVYNTFHPSWHIRHGALLGLKAILKSWKVTTFSSSFFSKWPEDIMVRCLCVLGLDRFGDYSGPCLEDGYSEGEEENQCNISSHVAPVREVAADIIALLLKMTSTVEKRRYCLGFLKKMFLYENHWEVRHGAMLAIQAMVNNNILSDDNDNDDCGGFLYKESVSMVFDGFKDDSDDVKSTCAQTASSILQSFDQYRKYDIPEHHFVTECSGVLWQALCKVDITASCSHDLLKCLCDLVQHDCNRTLATIRHAEESTMEEILLKICNFMDLPSDSIRFSCLKTLGLIVLPLSNTVIERMTKEECHKSTLAKLVAIFASLQRKIFESLFNDAYDIEVSPSHGTHEKIVMERTRTWDSVLNVLQRIMRLERNSAIFRTILDTFFHLMRRYIGVEAFEKHEWTYNISSKVDRQYCCQATAAKAMISYYSCLLSEVDDAKRWIVVVILSLLDSPWVEHCELASILLATIPAEDHEKFRYIIEHCKDNLWAIMENNPISLVVGIVPNVESVRQDEVAIKLCDALWVSSIQNDKINDDTRVMEIVSEIKLGWWKIFNKYGIDYSTMGSGKILPTSISSVRLLSGVSASIVAFGCTGLPSKLTPVIRSLMTQLKNEDNQYRLTNAASVLRELINLLMTSAEERHQGIAGKLLSNICRTACIPNYIKVMPAGFTKRGCDGAKQVLRQIIKYLPISKNIQQMEAIWSRLQPLATSDPAKCDFSLLSEGLSMLSCISSVMVKQSQSITNIVTSLLPTTLLLACTSPCIGMRQDATDAVKNLCEIDIDLAVPVVIPYLQGYAKDIEDDPKRLGAAVLLNSVVRSVGVALCPYVRYLLPIAMPAMTDPLKDCAELSALTFSHLVQLAPLVDTDIKNVEFSSDFNVDKNVQDNVQRVMDHLILGKPLPPHQLPSSISEALHSSCIHLRKYQMEGISWIQFLKNIRLNGALCDDMGLGKTMQALIGLAVTHCELNAMDTDTDHKSLVVCPSSVSGQWMNEITKLGFSDRIMTVLHYTGSKRKLEWDMHFCKSDIIITTYNVLRSDIDKLREYTWTYCILDEGHLLKNPKTQTAKAARQLRSNHKLILSGTPVQNNVNELWSIFDWLMPNYLGSNAEFSQNYARVITKGNLPTASSVEIRQGMEKLKQLHQQVLPFILRREKGDVAKELPPKVITDIPCAMTELQRRLYADYSHKNETRRALDLLEEMVTGKDSFQNGGNGSNNSDQNLLQSLLSLRFICTHPILLSRSKNTISSSSIPTRFDLSGKLLALNDLLRRARIVQDENVAADNDRSLLYVEEENPDINSADAFIKDISNDTDIIEDGYIDIDGIEANNTSKALIFAQFSQSLDVVEELLFKRVMPSLRYVRLDGKTPPSDRSQIIEAFQTDDSIRCMLLTSKVGSLGLNLQAADTVIFLESDWNPFVDLQATDRSHRIGQKNMVNVYRLITEDSIEEKIMAIQKKKIAMSEAIVNTENSTLYSMGTDRLLDLFSTNH